MRREQGFSYLIVMFLVAVTSIISVRALENSLTTERRGKEAELLRVGQAYMNAVRAYYENSPGTGKVYPPDFDALLLDGRGTHIRRPLRKLFRDPVTGSTEWGVVRAADGGIMGVFSLSIAEPFKKDGFTPELFSFTNAKRYSDWHFVYQPQ